MARTDGPRPPARHGLALPPMGRRTFVRGALLGAAGAGLPGLLSACGIDPAVQTPATCKSTDISATDKKLVVVQLAAVHRQGQEDAPRLHLDQTGIDVTYNADVNDNNEFFAKIANQLGDCQPIGRDLIVLTDWMAARLVKLGWLQTVDHANVPNVDKNLTAT